MRTGRREWQSRDDGMTREGIDLINGRTISSPTDSHSL